MNASGLAQRRVAPSAVGLVLDSSGAGRSPIAAFSTVATLAARMQCAQGYSGCIGVVTDGDQAGSRSVASLPSMSPLRIAVTGRQKSWWYLASNTAITLMHERPGHDWTVEDLGRQIGMLRSALHERFVDLVGQPPMQYLTHWRMQLGANRLREGCATVAAIAQEIGYDTEAAFSRAFKRIVGQPPAAWRRAQRPAA